MLCDQFYEKLTPPPPISVASNTTSNIPAYVFKYGERYSNQTMVDFIYRILIVATSLSPVGLARC